MDPAAASASTTACPRPSLQLRLHAGYLSCSKLSSSAFRATTHQCLLRQRAHSHPAPFSSAVAFLTTQQSSSLSCTPRNPQPTIGRPQVESHANAPHTYEASDVRHPLPDTEHCIKDAFLGMSFSSSSSIIYAASQFMSQMGLMTHKQLRFHICTLSDYLKTIDFGQLKSPSHALCSMPQHDSGYMRKSVQHATLSFCISIFMSASITASSFSNVAFATTGAYPHNIASFEEVQLPPIPRVFSPLKDLVPPVFEKVVLPNGLRVFLLEDHELGLVGGQLLIKAGSKNDPVDKVGLAAISSIVQRSGGTKQHPAALLDFELEEIAARIETFSGVSETSVGFRCLSEDLREVMSLFSEVVQNPLMPKSKLDLARTQLEGSIKRRADDPGGIAAREFSKLLYGERSAYSRYFTEDTLMHITQDDLIRFHKDTFRPTSAVLGIWGDFEKDAVKAMISSTLGSWSASPVSVQDFFPGKEVGSTSLLEVGNSFFEPQIYIINKTGLNQGFVRMGELGTSISDPDVFALDVLNDILNGFGGLLFNQVRSKEGLAYSVYGGWRPAAEHRGSFLAGGETQVNTVPQFISSVEKVLQSVTLQPPSEEDLSKAKEGIINSFVFNFVDSGAQLSRLMKYELFGIDQNFLFDYKKKVEELTSKDILEAAKRHLHLGAQPILVVADASKVQSALRTMGREIVVLHPEYLP